MKILLTNYILGGTTGSETWTATMQRELELLGHTVQAVTDAMNEPDEYDLAIINHNVCLKTVGHLTCKKIFTSHGVIPDLEQPIAGADIYVAVSEEVQQNLAEKGFTSTIIRNGIDTEKFKPLQPTEEELTSVLFSSNYPSQAQNTIAEACRMKGMVFRRIGGINRTTGVVEAINAADVVIGLGRTAYEAMSCGRNVIVYDYNGGDGFVTPETIIDYRTNNCSGRKHRQQYTAHDLATLFDMYQQSLGTQLREYIIEHNNIKKTVQEYLRL
jgi:hypothetical protein